MRKVRPLQQPAAPFGQGRFPCPIDTVARQPWAARQPLHPGRLRGRPSLSRRTGRAALDNILTAVSDGHHRLPGRAGDRNSTGNGGLIGPGDVQWMTAASGILHEEFHSKEFTRKGGTLEMVAIR